MSISQCVAYKNGEWLPAHQVGLGLDDWGNLQGATLVERMRTVRGIPLDVPGHLERLKNSAAVLQIAWPESLDERLIEECTRRNRLFHAHEDFAVVLLLTPGSTANVPAGSVPTLILHTSDLHWRALAYWYRRGQSLIIADNRNVPANSWPTHMKSRSRMHYFLADQQAARCGYAHAGAAMLGQDGCLTESSVANLLIVEGNTLVSPPMETVLHGLSLKRTLRLAEDCGMQVRFESIPLPRAMEASEVLLTGSSGCLWAAERLGERVFANPAQQPACKTLTRLWCNELGLEFVDQAFRNAQSLSGESQST